ncbi:MAG: hypothetical protein AB1593_00655 [Pseudomonadota bacterium]
MTRPSLAILFWYYRAPELCSGRLRELARLNPGVPIFGLYGGDPKSYPQFAGLGTLLDDDWVFEDVRDADWKWRHGDQMLSRWFEARGHALAWDRLVIAQWDLLACAPMARYFSGLQKNEVYLPGLRPIEPLRARWWWTRPGTPEGADYLAFVDHMARQYRYRGPFEACQFMTAGLPRAFMAAYARASSPEPGFLEYKLPAYARALGFSPVDLPHLHVAWPGETPSGRVVLTAAKRDIDDLDIAAELLRPEGARLFHPVTRTMPIGARAWTTFVARRLPRLASRSLRSRMRT